MNIPLLPSSIVASIAGSDFAASQRVAAASTSEKSVQGIAGVETVDSIDKGNESADSEADGRQTLDTFERHQPEDPDESNAELATEVVSIPALSDPTTSVGTRLDFSA